MSKPPGSSTNSWCYVRGKAPSTELNDVRIRLRYTNSGFWCERYIDTTVQKPTSLTRHDLGYDIQTCDPISHIGNMRRWFRDTVYDQFNPPQPVAHARADESWTGGCNLQERDEDTDCNGVVKQDDQWSRWGFQCTVDNYLYCTDVQTVNVSGWGCMLRYRRWDYLGPSPNPHIDSPGMALKSTLQRTWDAQDRTPPNLSTVIERFEVADQTVPSAVVRLANEQGVLCGLYVVPWTDAQAGTPEPFTSISATFHEATLAQILDGLVALDPRFTWREDRGLINVALASTVRDPVHPLNTSLPLFVAEEVPYLLALFFGGGEFRDRITPAPLFEEVYLSTGLLVGFGYSGPRWEAHPPVTVNAEGWTTVKEHGK